uniref:Three-finger toxin n=1 Tax=Calliophis bivirgatus TaxID=8633 RepID=A0A898IJN7_CALBG|nr:three-finger toxin [Calliophis bivirgatus]
MKSLLLVLVVVGFVYLTSGYTLLCRKCNRTVCDLNANCAAGENQCYIVQNKNDTTGRSAIQGCTATCPTPKSYQKVKCCSIDYCNSSI